jgi:type I restriction enzyme S subunit
LPSLAIQSLIADVLSAYDDLFENNTRRIAILEEMARRIFEEWFVHFRAPGCDGLPMVESAIGPMPQGWEVKRLRELADETRDPADPRAIDPETVYVGLEHIPRRSTTFVDWGKAGQVGSLKLKFQTGDILFGKIRPYFHKCAVAPVVGVASSDAIIIRAKSLKVRALVLSLTSSDAFVAHAVKTSNGTKMPRADWKVLREYPLAIPPSDLGQRFELAVWPMIELAAKLAAQNRNLRAQRDLLLPKLISGEIEVNAASASLKEAAE